jgi:hypothetical protein
MLYPIYMLFSIYLIFSIFRRLMQTLKNENDSTFCKYTLYIQICVWIPVIRLMDSITLYMSSLVYWKTKNKIHYLNTFDSIAAIVQVL